MSFTGRFNPDFNRQSDLPSADLPRETLEELAARQALEQQAEEEEDE